MFKHGNAAGTAPKGGVLVVVGDDHGAKSSSLPHQSDHIFTAAMMPVLNPSGVQEFLDFGLHGWAMSRYSGCWVAFKAVGIDVPFAALYLDDRDGGGELALAGSAGAPPEAFIALGPRARSTVESVLQRYWGHHLTVTALRDGNDSEKYRSAVAAGNVVDSPANGLQWTIRPDKE